MTRHNSSDTSGLDTNLAARRSEGSRSHEGSRQSLALLCSLLAALAGCKGGGQSSGISASQLRANMLDGLGAQPPGTTLLFLNISGVGLGTVASAPTPAAPALAWSCDTGGDSCGAYVAPGTAVSFAPNPGASSIFVSWGGECSGNGPCQITTSGVQTVLAVFQPHTVTAVLPGLGQGAVTSSYGAPVCSGGQCVLSLTNSAPASVTLTATASPGSYFAGWFGGGCSGTGTCTVTTNQAQAVDAFFATNQTAVNVWVPGSPVVSGAGGGTIGATGALQTSCTASGSTTECVFSVNTSALPQTVTLTATPNATSVFSGWGGACSGTGSCTVSVTQPTNVTAIFLARQLSVEVFGNGTVAATGFSCSLGTCTAQFTASSPATLTLNATPGTGSAFVGWYDGCSGTGTCQVTTAGQSSVIAVFQTATGSVPPLIEAFSANPPSIISGQSAGLNWFVNGATSLSIDNGVGGVTGHGVTVKPTATTTYTLTAKNSFGSSTMATTVVVQAPAQPPTIASFTASPSTISAGQTTKLSWSVTGAVSISINNGVGTVGGTSANVTPTATTTYTLTATNGAGSSTANAVVTVTAAAPFQHPAGWVDMTLTAQCPNEVQVGGSHACGGDMSFYMPGQCTSCHGNGSDFTTSGGSSQVACSMCHLNAFASTTCGSFNVPSPCSCDLCHTPPQITTAITQGQCSVCHTNVTAITGSDVTSHSTGTTQSSCTGCHDLSHHMSGTVYLVGVGATSCTQCHSGQGQVLGTITPPVLQAGWTQTSGGDFHGATPGTCYDPVQGPISCTNGVTPTGFGGTLIAPYARGQGNLPCEACHDDHASTTNYLFAATVNGKAIPSGSISIDGVGAEVLCSACHQGNNHQGCLSSNCHAPLHSWGYATSHTTDPAPPGSACFYCHGHEGLTANWTTPWPLTDPSSGNWCSHCHAGNPPQGDPPLVPPGTTSAPGITSGKLSCPASTCGASQPSPQLTLLPNGNVFNITPTSASIYWETNEAASSLVEYGIGTAGYVVGTPAVTPYPWPSANGYYPHLVTLTGLTGSTTYSWRIRTEDPYRNVTETPIQTFTTANPNVPVPPTLTTQPEQYWTSQQFGCGPTDVVNFSPFAWQAVTVPSGDAIQYELQFGTDPAFATYVTDSGWISATTYTATNVTIAACYNGTTYYWRVRARDSVQNLVGGWSSGSFLVWVQCFAIDCQ